MEIWKPIPGFKGYEVSHLGNIKSYIRYEEGRILKPCTNLRGYKQCILGKFGGIHTVHKLVMISFIGPVPEAHEINHINGIKDDNRLENLEYCTKSQNKIHSITVLGKTRGETHANSKINDEIVREIRRLGATGLLHREIAARFNITRANVSYILRGDAWSHVI